MNSDTMQCRQERLDRANARFAAVLPYVVAGFFAASCVFIGKESAETKSELGNLSESHTALAQDLDDLRHDVATRQKNRAALQRLGILINVYSDEVRKEHGDISRSRTNDTETLVSSYINALPGQIELNHKINKTLKVVSLEVEDMPYLSAALNDFNGVTAILNQEYESEGDAKAAIDRVASGLQSIHRRLDLLAANPGAASSQLLEIEDSLVAATEDALVEFSKTLQKFDEQQSEWSDVPINDIPNEEAYQLVKLAESICRQSRTSYILLSSLVHSSPKFSELQQTFARCQENAFHHIDSLAERFKSHETYQLAHSKLKDYSGSVDRRTNAINADSAFLNTI